MQKPILNFRFSIFHWNGRLAQLARAPHWHCGGRWFKSNTAYHKRYKTILTYIFPVVCIGCESEDSYLCHQCRKRLQPHPEICPVSHRFSPDFQVHIDYQREAAYQGIAIWFAYSDLLKKLILQLKYYHRYDVASFLADRLALVIQTNRTLQKLSHTKKTIISSIPSHRYRQYFTKGYNQSELLAQAVASNLNIPYQPLVTKKRHTRIQAFLSRKQRLKNLEGVFSLRKWITLMWNELIIFIDDVTTTGSTIQEAAKCLKKSFPKLTIWGSVIGRHT